MTLTSTDLTIKMKSEQFLADSALEHLSTFPRLSNGWKSKAKDALANDLRLFQLLAAK